MKKKRDFNDFTDFLKDTFFSRNPPQPCRKYQLTRAKDNVEYDHLHVQFHLIKIEIIRYNMITL